MPDNPNPPSSPVPVPSPVEPGHTTSEFKVAGVGGVALLAPIIQTVLTKTGDTRLEVICLTAIVCVYIICRTVRKTL